MATSKGREKLWERLEEKQSSMSYKLADLYHMHHDRHCALSILLVVPEERIVPELQNEWK